MIPWLAWQQSGDPLPYGPGSWGPGQWIGAGVYVAIFLACVILIGRLARAHPPEDGGD